MGALWFVAMRRVSGLRARRSVRCGPVLSAALLVLALVGSVAVHALGALSAASTRVLAGSEAAGEAADTRGAELGTASTQLLPWLAAAIVLVGMVLVLRRRGGAARAFARWIVVAIPAAFLLQELAERMLGVESFPFGAHAEPDVLLAIVGQVPFVLLALALVHALRAVVRTMVRSLARPATRPAPRPSIRSLPRFDTLSTHRPVIDGHPQRGPPLPHVRSAVAA